MGGQERVTEVATEGKGRDGGRGRCGGQHWYQQWASIASFQGKVVFLTIVDVTRQGQCFAEGAMDNNDN